MNKNLVLISLFFVSVVSIFNWVFKLKEELHEAKWNVPDTTLAITINGEISTTFPTSAAYETSVECTSGTGKAEWNGSKWILTTSGITKGSTKCNATFIARELTFSEIILTNNEVKEPLTTPGKEISSEEEALLASTEDDYGTSYYFRGAVKNNYVQFANKCWRIVRIGGDSTVKLILHNDNIVNGSNPCSSVNNNGENAYAHYSDSTYKSSFNNENNDNAYIGFMYGTPSSTTYEATHANTNKSTILTNLETWYNNNLKSYESAIDDNVFCNDKTRNTDDTFNPFYYPMIYGEFGTGYSDNATYYGATVRMVKSNHVPGGTGPSLKCNEELSKITSKIGLITIDEYAYAGGAYYKSNPTTYLEENSTSIPYWYTISPSAFYYEDDGDNESASAEIWVISTGNNNTDGEMYVTSYYGVRPYISLKSDTTIEPGLGTSEAPYKINS